MVCGQGRDDTEGKWRQLRVLIYLHLGYVSCPPYSALPPGLGKGLLPLQIDAPVGEERSWEEGEGWVKSWTQSNTSHHWAQSVFFQSLGWNFQRFLPLIWERTRAPGARLLPTVLPRFSSPFLDSGALKPKRLLVREQLWSSKSLQCSTAQYTAA